jgi:hypothetical protein
LPQVSDVLKFVSHSRRVQDIAARYGWLPGARYTNLRDVRHVTRIGFLDINWRSYDFERHLTAVKATRPMLTVARDVVRRRDLARTLDEAHVLGRYCDFVVVVPKARSLAEELNEVIPAHMLLGFSVPTKYGSTTLSPRWFKRPVHLLGGRPDVQRRLANEMPVVSVDCNRFTLDAAFGDYFDGETFRPHPKGGYERCLRDSVRNISKLWMDYRISVEFGLDGTPR